MANYPSGDAGYRRRAQHNRRARAPTVAASAGRDAVHRGSGPARRHSAPRRRAGRRQRVTVTRAAAQRSREMGSKMYRLFHRAATADGADKSGLTALTWR